MSSKTPQMDKMIAQFADEMTTQITEVVGEYDAFLIKPADAALMLATMIFLDSEAAITPEMRRRMVDNIRTMMHRALPLTARHLELIIEALNE